MALSSLLSAAPSLLGAALRAGATGLRASPLVSQLTASRSFESKAVIHPRDLTVTICGGGNAAHVAAGMYAHQGAKVHMFMPFGDEAKWFKEGHERGGGVTVNAPEGIYKGEVHKVCHDPTVVKDSDIILMIMPAYVHEATLKAIAPHVEHGQAIGAVPGPGAFDLLARHVLGPKADGMELFAACNLPWTCRTKAFGEEVDLLSEKTPNQITCRPVKPIIPICDMLNALSKKTRWTYAGNFLETTMWPTNAIIHPGVMYGLFSKWDGKPFEQSPLFYQAMDDYTAETMLGLDNDIQNTVAALKSELHVDINVPKIHPYFKQTYGDAIGDPTCLKTTFQTNEGFKGLRTPATQLAQGGWVPNFRFRYLTEDLPHGLCVMRNFAEIVKVDTPYFDKVITWGQEKCGHSYLVDGKIQGPNVAHSGCPERFGIRTLDQLRTEYGMFGKFAVDEGVAESVHEQLKAA